ncbi:hypothetical protein NOV18_26930 [Pseudomonas asiatica]|uniref:Uncharacterized protein n=1 Tax=Pseudomonas asiatica TaxID=2219225 RepID=A0AAJ5IGZ2_9PSED|nr:hypothetical protein [Pseudomonas asiatica]UUC18834.1 hypothetical protein NOV18_26930 [Pseudomonas asiatica]
MKKFQGVDVEFGELLRILSRPVEAKARSYSLTSSESGDYLPASHFRVLWEDDKWLEPDAPSIVIGNSYDVNNILPRLLALPSAVMPVTSIVKFWNVEDFKSNNPFDIKPLERTVALGFVGLIIGELTSLISSVDELRTMGMDSVRRTLSFVCAQSIIRGWKGQSLARLADRWLEASVLTDNEVNPSAIANIVSVSDFLCTLSDSVHFESISSEVLGQRIQLWLEAQKDLDQRDLLKRSIPQITRELRSVSSREKRYDIVMDALQSSAGGVYSTLEQGFLISLIEPGSFEFLNLAKSMDPAGLVMTAYSVFVVMLGKESALRNFNGFGGVVLRQAFQQNTDVNSDISVEELNILLNKRRSAPLPFRTRSPWLIEVEIAPMVVGCFANVARRKASSQRTLEASEAIERQEALRGKLITAMRALEDVYGIVEREQLRPDSTFGKPRGRRK